MTSFPHLRSGILLSPFLTNLSPRISISSGNGYAGSTYRVTGGGTGNWMGDDEPISESSQSTWIMPLEHEGKTIYWRRSDGVLSNSIEMWVPVLDATNNLFVMDARQGFVMDSSDRVSSWANQRDGIFATQTTDSLKPTYSKALGTPTLYFDKGDGLTTTSVYPAPTARTYVGLVSFETVDPSTLSGAATDGAAVFRRGTDRRLNIVKGNSVLVAASTDPVPDATPLIVSMQTNTTTHSFRVNGIPNGTISSNVSYVSSTIATIGFERNTNRHQGHIGTHVICDSNLSSDDIQRIEGFIAHTSNLLDLLPSNHAYKTVAPKIEREVSVPFNIAALMPASWHDVSDSSTITLLDGRVNRVLDKSGNGRQLFTSTAAKQPIYNASDSRVGGKPTISATRGGDILITQTDNLSQFQYAVADMFFVTQFANGTQNSFTTANILTGYGPNGALAGNDGYAALLGGNVAANGHPRFMGALNTGRVISTGALDTDGAYRNLGTSKIGSGDTRYPALLPLPWSVLRIVPTYTPNVSTRYIGAQDAQSSRAWAGPWGEIIMFDYVLSERSRRRLTRTLMSKWGIS